MTDDELRELLHALERLLDGPWCPDDRDARQNEFDAAENAMAPLRRCIYDGGTMECPAPSLHTVEHAAALKTIRDLEPAGRGRLSPLEVEMKAIATEALGDGQHKSPELDVERLADALRGLEHEPTSAEVVAYRLDADDPENVRLNWDEWRAHHRHAMAESIVERLADVAPTSVGDA